MAIKNYTSAIPINRIFDQLQRILASHGARQIRFDYGEDGKIDGLTFMVPIRNGVFVPIKLPARVEKAHALLQKQYQAGHMADRRRQYTTRDHAYRVAWRNILDWVEAQMALVDIEMAKLEEIFLPYVADRSGKTLFDKFEQINFKLLTE
jgi:hypothetical protein